MNIGTRRASARRKSGSICSRSGSGAHSGSVDSTRVAPSVFPSTSLISRLAASMIGSTALVPGSSIDSRTTPMRVPARTPAGASPATCTA
jgi:hypothetical protein